MPAVRRSTIEPVLVALRETEEGIPDRFLFYDVNSKLNFDAGASDRLSLAVYGGHDVQHVVPSTDMNVAMRSGNRTGSLNWTHLFSEHLFSNFTFTGSQITHENNFEAAAGGTIVLKLPGIAVAFYGPTRLVANAIDDNLNAFKQSQMGTGTTSPGGMDNLVDPIEGGRGIFGSMYRDDVVVIRPPAAP